MNVSEAEAQRLLSRARSKGLSVTEQVRPKERRNIPRKWESAYARDILEPRRLSGELVRYDFQGLKLKLATGAYYTPDWVAYRRDGGVEIHEVKGHWREAAKVRWKVAKELYPLFRFTAARLERGTWGDA